ncbi:MAG: DUF6288 domain-containing protein [Planctomycetota bacterium]
MQRLLPPLILLVLALTAAAQDLPEGARRGDPANAKPDPRALGAIGGEGIPAVVGTATGIEVTSLITGGAGEKAGLLVGDVIVGVGSKGLAGGNAWLVLTTLIEKPRKEGKAVVLRVRRDGESKKLDLVIPAAKKKPKATFTECERCMAILPRALAKLASMQKEDGSFPTQLGGNNGLVAVTSIATLAFVAGGSSPKEGDHGSTLAKARDWLLEHVGEEEEAFTKASGKNWSQVNWNLGYGALALARLYSLDPTDAVKTKLVAVRDALLANMEESGGWAHGPSNELPYPLDYAELTACGNICLAGLGEIASLGIEVPKEKISLAVNYVTMTSDGGGGVGYSARPGQRGMGAAGRSASMALAMSRLSMERHPFYRKLTGYVRQNLAKTPHGHVSPDFHYFFASQACRVMGKKDWLAFVKTFRTEILSLWNGDGTFGVRPADTSRSGFPNTDRTMGVAWRTATFAMILGLESGRLDRPAGENLSPPKK